VRIDEDIHSLDDVVSFWLLGCQFPIPNKEVWQDSQAFGKKRESK